MLKSTHPLRDVTEFVATVEVGGYAKIHASLAGCDRKI